VATNRCADLASAVKNALTNDDHLPSRPPSPPSSPAHGRYKPVELEAVEEVVADGRGTVVHSQERQPTAVPGDGIGRPGNGGARAACGRVLACP